jgi:hypothetical protein
MLRFSKQEFPIILIVGTSSIPFALPGTPGSANVRALQQITRSVPIVFANVIDPVVGQFAVIQAMMPPSFGVELTTIDGHNPGEIERAVTAFAREPNGGLIVTASPSAVTHRDLIISVATRCRPRRHTFVRHRTFTRGLGRLREPRCVREHGIRTRLQITG